MTETETHMHMHPLPRFNQKYLTIFTSRLLLFKVFLRVILLLIVCLCVDLRT